MMIRLLAPALFILALSASGCASRNVTFADSTRFRASEVDVVRAIYDRYGTLYPSRVVPVPDTALRRNRRGASERELSVEAYFADARAQGRPAWTALQHEIGLQIPPTLNQEAMWDTVQGRLRSAIGDEIHRLVRQGNQPPRPLIVLVHGFNSDMDGARAWYHIAQDTILKRGHDPVFLEVYWDGLVAGIPFGIWRSAQYNWGLVGLELRRLLNELDPEIPVRVLTHSSGGPLVASTLGNASAVLPARDSVYRRYHELANDTVGDYRPPPFRDFRVGMIVPAAHPGTFSAFDRTALGPNRLIIGINPHDFAIAKIVFCGALGSTCLSGRRASFCKNVRAVFANNANVQPYVFDFSGSEENERSLLFWDEHAMAVYLRRDDITPFLDLLLNNDITHGGEELSVCRT
jgi:hypothetical protein